MARVMSSMRGWAGWPGRLAALGLAGCLLLAQAVQAAESVTYFHLDALGSPVAATDADGNVLWREAYRPYGERLRQEATDQDLWYTGKPEEAEFGLQYFGARWYDPATGRFQGLDPAGVDPQRSVHSFNRYAYAGANPYKYTDPDGELPILVPAVIWAAGAGVTAYDTVQTYKTEGAGAAATHLAVGATLTAATGGGALAYKAWRAGKAAQRATSVARKTTETGRQRKFFNELSEAEGRPHTVFRRSEKSGRIENYQTFDHRGQAGGNKRFRGVGKPHGGVRPPLVLEPKPGHPGGRPFRARPAGSDETPKGF